MRLGMRSWTRSLAILGPVAFHALVPALSFPPGDPQGRATIRIPVRVFDPQGKLLKKARVYFVRQAMSGSRVGNDDRYGYQLLSFASDGRGRFRVRLPRGGNLSLYAVAERDGKRFASRIKNDVFAGRPQKLHLQEELRRSLVFEGLALWRKRFGPKLFLEVYANSSVTGLIPGPSIPRFRLPLQDPSAKGPFPDRAEVPLPPLPLESLWVALLDAKGAFLESLFLGRSRTARLGPLRFGVPKFRSFRLQTKGGAALPRVRVLVRSGTRIVGAERQLRTDAQGRVRIPYGLGKKSVIPLQDEMNPIALFLPPDCRVLYRHVVSPGEKIKGEVSVVATRVKGSQPYRFAPKALREGTRYVQVVGAVSETGFVRDQVVPLPSEAFSGEEGRLFRLPSSGPGREEWNGLLRIQGGQAFPVIFPRNETPRLIRAPAVRLLLTILRPGEERSFGGRVALGVNTGNGFFILPYSADSHGQVLLALPRFRFPLLAYEPRVGLKEKELDLRGTPARVEEKFVLEPFYELLVRVQKADGTPVEGAICRWSASWPMLLGGDSSLSSLVLGSRSRGREKSDANGVVRLYLNPDVETVGILVHARLGGKTLKSLTSVATKDGIHNIRVVLK